MNQSRAFIQWSIIQFFFIASIVFSVMFGVYAGVISTSLNINQGQFGLLAGVFFVFYAIIQLYSGKLFVKIPTRILLFVSALISALGSSLLAMASSIGVLFVARILLGIGLASTYVGVLYIVQRGFKPQAFPLMSSLSQALANFAGTAFVFFSGAILSVLSYKVFFNIMALVFLICAISIVLFIKVEQSIDEPHDSSLFADIKLILKNSQVWWAAIFFTGLFGSILSFANLFSISFQMHAFDRVTASASIISSMILFGVTIGSIMSGIITNQIKNYAITARIFAIISVLSFAIILFTRFNNTYYEIIAIVVYFILGFGLGGSVMAFQGIQENVPQERLRPLATSFVLTLSYIFVGFIEQPVIGQLLSLTKLSLLANDSPYLVILKHKTLLDFSVHDEFYKYAVGLSFILFTLIVSTIGSFFLRHKQ